jgi:hypothetical protein
LSNKGCLASCGFVKIKEKGVDGLNFKVLAQNFEASNKTLGIGKELRRGDV